MQTWPSTLPRPQPDLSKKAETSTLRSGDSDAKVAQRDRFKFQLHQATVSWKFLGAEFDAFQSFFLNDLHGGADWFVVELPVAGEGILPVVARFAEGEYRHTHSGVLAWNVSANLEYKKTPVWSEDAYDLLVSIEDPADLHRVVNFVLPLTLN